MEVRATGRDYLDNFFWIIVANKTTSEMPKTIPTDGIQSPQLARSPPIKPTAAAQIIKLDAARLLGAVAPIRTADTKNTHDGGN